MSEDVCNLRVPVSPEIEHAEAPSRWIAWKRSREVELNRGQRDTLRY